MSITGNPVYDAQQYLDTMDFNLTKLRDLFLGKDSPLAQAGGEQAASVFEDVVLATFGRWVLTQLECEKGDVTEMVRSARAELESRLRLNTDRDFVAEVYDAPRVDIFSDEDLEGSEDEVGPEPVQLQAD